MKCLKTKKLIEPYLEGKLSKRLASEIETHIKNCPECKKYSHNLITHILPYKKAYVYPLNSHFPGNNSIRRRKIKTTTQRKKAWWYKLIPNILTAMSLLFIIIGLLIAQKLLTR